jgi:uncharacterized protein YhfF
LTQPLVKGIFIRMTDHLNDEEQSFFDHYFSKLGDSQKAEISRVTSSIAGDDNSANELLGLYLCGKKSAGSSLLQDFIKAGDRLPEPGHHWIVLDRDRKPKCILKTVRVEIHKFKDIPERIAQAEGEGDLSLAYWRKAHEAFFKPHLERLKIQNIEDADVVTEFFECVHKAE